MNSKNSLAVTSRPPTTHRGRHLPKIVALLSAVLMAFGCADGTHPSIVGPDRPPTLESQAGILRQVYSDQLTDLMDSGTDLTDEEAVLDRTLLFYEAQFGSESRDYEQIRDAVQQRRASTGASNLTFAGTPLQQFVLQVTRQADQAQTYGEFQSALGQFEREVLASPAPRADRQAELSYLVLLDETLRALATHPLGSSNLDHMGVATTAATAGAFSFWRCAAGVVGGAILGGFTGAGGGSVIPALGTAAGGVIGAVAGGLVGAATSC